jgi:hypothetical protein
MTNAYYIDQDGVAHITPSNNPDREILLDGPVYLRLRPTIGPLMLRADNNAIRVWARPLGLGYSKRNPLRLSRLIGKPYYDHANGDTLDNRSVNLRPATTAQNVQNQHKPLRGRSRYKGVYPSRSGRPWSATITAFGRRRYLGVFDTQEAAARAYDQAARQEHGAFARVNFPMPGEQCCLDPLSVGECATEPKGVGATDALPVNAVDGSVVPPPKAPSQAQDLAVTPSYGCASTPKGVNAIDTLAGVGTPKGVAASDTPCQPATPAVSN